MHVPGQHRLSRIDAARVAGFAHLQACIAQARALAS